jgi:superfamily II DNA or RNA helicase
VSVLDPGEWQRDAIAGIVRRLAGKNAVTAALLQLPTGFGKSLVAVRIFQQLRRRRPGLRLMVVLPKQQVPAGWKQALGFGDEEHVPLFEPLRIKGQPGTVCFQTRLELKRALIVPGRGWPATLARTITGRPHLVVIDEVHRHRRLLETFSYVFRDPHELGRQAVERYLSSALRLPSHGKRRWPKWLLLSATPINPVSLDAVDPLDATEVTDTFDPGEDERHDEQVLADALKTIHGGLAYLSGLRYADWFDEHVGNAREKLHLATAAQPIEIPKELVVWPSRVRVPELRPNGTPRWQCLGPARVEAELARAVSELVTTATAVESLPSSQPRRRATAERFVLSGGMLKTRGHKIQGEPYSKALALSVRAAVAAHWRAGVRSSEKLRAITKFIDSIEEEHVLIFCVHRAVARALAAALSSQVGTGSLRTGIGDITEATEAWFNERTRGETRILVVTDACSEAIDLHERANVLVHYELPWSPLRVLQRVGRLWRLRRRDIQPGSRPKRPRLPGVVHFAHPGSVDEEIISRLRRRWGYLCALGLDYLSFEQAMGIRLPAVPW